MSEDDKALVERLRSGRWLGETTGSKAADRIEQLTAEVERLREALDAAWRHATTMRNASKLVSPYPNDHAKRSIWVRSLYHEGKQLHETLKPARAALGESHD